MGFNSGFKRLTDSQQHTGVLSENFPISPCELMRWEHHDQWKYKKLHKQRHEKFWRDKKESFNFITHLVARGLRVTFKLLPNYNSELDVHGSVRHSINYLEITNKMLLYIRIYYSNVSYCSTCFERHIAHHQELKNCICSLWFYIRLWLPAGNHKCM